MYDRRIVLIKRSLLVLLALLLVLALAACGGDNNAAESNNGQAVSDNGSATEEATEPTEEPVAEPTDEPTAEPTEEAAEPTEEPTAEPTEEPTAEPTEEATAEPTEEPTSEPAGDAVRGEQLYNLPTLGASGGAPGCAACHSPLEGTVIVGPSHFGVGTAAATRVEGMSAEEYLRESIVNPNAYIVDGFVADIMYQLYGEQLSEEDIADLVAYLLTLQ
jgi:mono/diheme cytochrome c family protein/predicted small lipoprotein YifL